MSTFSLLETVLAVAAGASLCAAAEEGGARVPVLLELFTSEGCSSCPPADRLLETLDRTQPVPGADLIVLSEHVDYWDYLGWKDPFSSRQYSARQAEYASKFRRDGVYTPQLVVDGRFEFVGSDSREALSAIGKAIEERKIAIAISDMTRNGNAVTAHVALPAGHGGKAVLYVALADGRADTQVASGENAGRNLGHVSVTRVLKTVGAVDLESGSARDVTLSVPAGAGSKGMRVIAFLQDPASGHVLGVAAQKL